MAAKTTQKSDVALAPKHREIAISEFFAKNRHLLGFDNPMKSLLTTVREAVDNALDACEEEGILPSISVEIRELKEGLYNISVEDNGPGISKAHLPNIFAKLLYGSKFHRLKQSRGQQGIGISAAVMYGQMTTGKPAIVISKQLNMRKAHKMSLQIDTKKNAPKIMSDEQFDDAHWQEKSSGTKISIELEGSYKEGKHGVPAYIRQSALANPHASMELIDPKGVRHVFPRLLDRAPVQPKEIKPHPLGIELGTLIQFLHDASQKSLELFLKAEFSRVSEEIAVEICRLAQIPPKTAPQKLNRTDCEALYKAIQEVKLLAPPTNCLSPLNEEAINKALYWFFVEAKADKTEESKNEEEIAQPKKTSTKKGPQVEFDFFQPEEKQSGENERSISIEKKVTALMQADESAILDEKEGFFLTSVTRPPNVYRGNPFQVEVGLFYGKTLPADNPVQVFRFANRVPLQYQASACAMTKAAISVPWKSYGLQQARGAVPIGPLVIMMSISSVWVPYTSESKEAVAHYPEIIKELRLALMEAARRLQRFLHRRKRHADEEKKRSYIEKYLSPIHEALCEILGQKNVDVEKLESELKVILEKSRAHKTVKLEKHEIAQTVKD